VIPLRDYNPTRRPSLLTWGLILINFAVYFYLAQNPVMDENAIARYAVIPADITAGRHLGTLITSMFLHANLLHVGGNMLFLWIFGNNVEDRLGEIKFVIIYLASGIAGSLLQIFIDPTSTLPMLGASGAISGILAAYVLYFPRARVLTFIVPFFFVTLTDYIRPERAASLPQYRCFRRGRGILRAHRRFCQRPDPRAPATAARPSRPAPGLPGICVTAAGAARPR